MTLSTNKLARLFHLIFYSDLTFVSKAALTCCYIVKQVSWFKSSLLLRINIKHTHQLQFLTKTKESIFNRKIYTTDERRIPSVAWLGFLRQTILIKEKCKHLSKMSDRVSRKCF